MGLCNQIKKKISAKEYNSLTEDQKKIYNSILTSFPETCEESAYNKALEGGIVWDYQYK